MPLIARRCSRCCPHKLAGVRTVTGAPGRSAAGRLMRYRTGSRPVASSPKLPLGGPRPRRHGAPAVRNAATAHLIQRHPTLVQIPPLPRGERAASRGERLAAVVHDLEVRRVERRVLGLGRDVLAAAHGFQSGDGRDRRVPTGLDRMTAASRRLDGTSTSRRLRGISASRSRGGTASRPRHILAQRLHGTSTSRRLRGLSTSRPRCRRDSSPRTIHVASPTDYPRRTVRRRDPSSEDPRGEST